MDAFQWWVFDAKSVLKFVCGPPNLCRFFFWSRGLRKSIPVSHTLGPERIFSLHNVVNWWKFHYHPTANQKRVIRYTVTKLFFLLQSLITVLPRTEELPATALNKRNKSLIQSARRHSDYFNIATPNLRRPLNSRAQHLRIPKLAQRVPALSQNPSPLHTVSYTKPERDYFIYSKPGGISPTEKTTFVNISKKSDS